MRYAAARKMDPAIAHHDDADDDADVTQSGPRFAVREPLPTLPEAHAPRRTVGRFSVLDAAARLPRTLREPIEIGVVENDDVPSGAPRRVLIHAWPNSTAGWERRYAVGADARCWIGPSRRGGTLEPVRGGHIVVVRVFEDRLIGAFEIELQRAMVHGTFYAQIRTHAPAGGR